jgi:hypothetical protein
MKHMDVSRDIHLKSMSMGVQVTKPVVRRLDGGGRHERGDYECRVPGCGWTAKGAKRTTALTHLKNKHGSNQVRI